METTRPTRRRLGQGLAGLAVLGAPAVRAQTAAEPAGPVPNRPVRIIVPFGPGSATDINTRLIAPRMAEVLGQPVVVENRSGATGAIGSEAVARSRPDGYTLVMGTIASHSILGSLMPNLPYDILRDFTPVGLASTSPNIVVVHPSVPARTLPEFVAWTKAQPSPVSYASTGSGGSSHLASELLRMQTGANITHVPYRNAAQSVTDTVAGHVMMLTYQVSVMPQVRAERLRALAVLSEQRVPHAPNVPTAVEQGLPDLVVVAWQGLFGPAGLPQPVVERLYEALREALSSPDIRRILLENGAEPSPRPAAAFRDFVRTDMARWAELARVAGVRME
jgi:tripartite-type tricarboxylate transporter receptor subunit TctC